MGGAAQRPAAAPSLLLLAVLFVGRAAAFGGGATALHGHAAFFDRDGDGVVTLSETYGAFRALGFGFGLSSVSAAFINGALGGKCRPENATSSKLDIYIEDIQKGKHGSDTGSYDTEGRFVPEKFEQIFAKHAKTVPDALTSDEVDQLLKRTDNLGTTQDGLEQKASGRSCTASARTRTASSTRTSCAASTTAACSTGSRPTGILPRRRS